MRLAWSFLLSATISAGISLSPAAAHASYQATLPPALPGPGPLALMDSTFDLAQVAPPPQEDAPPIEGPADFSPAPAPEPETRYRSLGSRMGAAKWETIGLFAYVTATQAYWTDETTHFHFKDEGWFGKNTNNLGIDKLTHAFNAYLFTEFLGARIARKTGDRARAAAPAAMLSMGLMLYGEMWDAHKEDSGFSVQDVIFNTTGAALSVLRHTVPGLEEKLDFRLLMMPNSSIYTFKGKRHYEQQHFLLALELAGFRALRSSPLRFVELQVGYRGKDFTNADRATGITPKRDIFFGVGVNIKQLFFKDSRSRLGRAIGSGLNYFQLPYTAVYDY
ncbi:DUF2279 domain-containing protein [Sphingobium sp.]|uniref:DUF2279 domain-containing protein n=1 Tax=Sphingobium sp. TaxID=1912891 RepID=UPI0035C746E9